MKPPLANEQIPDIGWDLAISQTLRPHGGATALLLAQKSSSLLHDAMHEDVGNCRTMVVKLQVIVRVP